MSAISKSGGLDQDEHNLKTEFKYQVGLLFIEHPHQLLTVTLEWPQLILSLQCSFLAVLQNVETLHRKKLKEIVFYD